MSNLNVKNIVHPTSGDTTPTENLSKQVCKAWVNFNGTGLVTIRASYNVSSITDNGTGKYTVNFAQTMANTNYAVSTTGSMATGISAAGTAWFSGVHTGSAGGSPLLKTTGQCLIGTAAGNTAMVDAPDIYVSVFGS